MCLLQSPTASKGLPIAVKSTSFPQVVTDMA